MWGDDDRRSVHLILHGPVFFALGLCLGAASYFSLASEPHFLAVIFIAAGSVCGAIWGLRFISNRALRILLMLLAGAGCGVLVAKVHTDLRPAPMLLEATGPTMVEGWVTEIEPGQNGVRLRIRPHAIGGKLAEDLPDDIRLTHALSLNVAPGRFVRCWAVIRPPPQPGLPGDYAFNRQAFFEGLAGVGYVQGRCRGGPLGMPDEAAARLHAALAMKRRQLAVHVRDNAGETADGFAAALASGDRSFMDQADIEALRGSGLAHLLAISGLHLGIVGGMVFLFVRRGLALWEWLALRFAVQKPAAFIALTATGVYMILSGASISTQRAFIMAAVFFGAILLDRSPLSFRSFAVAMIAVIFLQPHSVMTPGFQMSFAATGALIATYVAWRERRQSDPDAPAATGPVFILKSLVVTSAVGAAATAPFALYHFDRLAPAGFFANLAAMPIVTFVSAPSAGLALLAAPVGADGPFLRMFGWSLKLVLDVAHAFSDTPHSEMNIGDPIPGLVLLATSAGLAGACLTAGWRNRAFALVLSGVIASAFWWLSPRPIMHWSASGDLFVRSNETGWGRYGLLDGDGLGPLQFARLSLKGSCLDRDCQFATEAGRIAVLNEPIAQTCPVKSAMVLVASGEIPRCEQAVRVVQWGDVVAGNGFTWIKPRFGPARADQVTCGHRKWWPCLPGTFKADGAS